VTKSLGRNQQLIINQFKPAKKQPAILSKSSFSTPKKRSEFQFSQLLDWVMSSSLSGWWFGTFFIFRYIGNNI
jgi:hypothetical protein